jgi:hypothetical protein
VVPHDLVLMAKVLVVALAVGLASPSPFVPPVTKTRLFLNSSAHMEGG